jgi:hypothetical protein
MDRRLTLRKQTETKGPGQTRLAVHASPAQAGQADLGQAVNASARQVAQRALAEAVGGSVRQVEQRNGGGLPDGLKSGVESLSGMSMDHVKVHYNSSQPAQLNALAFARGSDIHLAPGQARHLPHEAWHVVQQAQGRVRPTMQLRAGVPVNDDAGLEAEADAMGARALSLGTADAPQGGALQRMVGGNAGVVQAQTDVAYTAGYVQPVAGSTDKQQVGKKM